MSSYELIENTAEHALFRHKDSAKQVAIHWSEYAVPHIKADDYFSLGFGYGYAHAKDRLLELSSQAIALRGQRCKYFGAEAIATIGFLKTTNLNSDLMYRLRIPQCWVDEQLAKLEPRCLDYISGYVLGLNCYAAALDDEQRQMLFAEEPLVEFELGDVLRATMRFGIMKELVEIGPALLASSRGECLAQSDGQSVHAKPVGVEGGFGSNAWAYGGDVVGDKGAILLGNPHSAWQRSPHQIRIYMHQYRLSLADELDVAGASFLGFPMPMTGYNADVAWTILDAAAVSSFVFQAMDVELGEQGASYLMDGQRKPLAIHSTEIEVLQADGQVLKQPYEFYESELGLLYKLPKSRTRAAGWYAITNAGEANAKGLEQFFAAARAKSTRDFVSAIEQHRGIMCQLLVADRHGDVAYTIAGNVLPISDEQMAQSHVGEASSAFNIVDGTRSECAFRDAQRRPLCASAEFFPRIISRGMLHNTNNSYKYTEYGRVQPDYPAIFGQHKHAVQADLKQAAGLSYDPRLLMSFRRMQEIARLKEISPETALRVLFDNRNYAAETFLELLLSLTQQASSASAKQALAVLAAWDRKNNAESRGALLFHQFWLQVVALDVLSVCPSGDPARGSSLLVDEHTAPKLLACLEHAYDELQNLGFAADTAWGEVLYQSANQQAIALHGGSYQEGILNGEMPAPLNQQGFPYILFGSAYIQCVYWNKQQVQPYVLLSHGQADGQQSSARAKQLQLFANKRLYRMAFAPQAAEQAEWLGITASN